MRFRWPDNVKCMVCLSFEFDAESVELGFYKAINNGRNWGGFAPRFGIPRILDLLKKYDIIGTFFVPGWDAEQYPESVKDIAAEGHEIAAHGYLHEDFSTLDEKAEKEVFERSRKILSGITGTEPCGFRSGAYGKPISPNTLRFAKETGCIYDSSFLDDDEPYRIRIDGKEVDMIEIPCAWVLNDISFISPSPFSSGLGTITPTRSPRWILDLWEKEFDSLYEDCGFFNLVVHPAHMGWGSRMPLMENIIRFIRGYTGIRFATYGEIAELCLKQL